MVYVWGYEKCLAGEELMGSKVGTKLASISYSPFKNGESGDFESLVLK